MADGLELGAFRLDRPVASGGMAEVWAGTHVASGMAVSVKVITGDRARDDYFRQAFRSEIRAVAGLDHPGVILVLDHGEVGPDGVGTLAPGSPYLVMEHASAGTLRDAHRRVLVWPEIQTILSSLLRALAHAHARGVIHRDLKPGNVLVCGSEDPRPGIKLSDFGLARLMEDHDRPGSVEAVRGTLHYMAPEQCQGLWRDQGAWTDLYALGCIAYQMATGRAPFKGLRGDALMQAHVHTPPPPMPPRRGLPEGYAAWVDRLLRKSPWERYQRAADAAWALSRLPEPDDVGPTRWVFPSLATTQGLSDDLDTDPTPRTPLPDDVDDAVGEPTERVAAVVGGPAQPGAGGRQARPGDAPPVPSTWREPLAPLPDLRLLDAGLGLFGLRPIAMVGRDAERDALWRSLLEVDRAGDARCVIIEGPNGTGISRLASWMASRAHEVGAAHVLLMTHEATGPARRPVRRMLARALGVSRLPRDEVEVRTLAFARRHGLDEADAHEIVDLLRPVGGAPRDMTPERYALVRRLLLCFAAERPVVLRIEDLQWGRDAVALVRSLLDAPTTTRAPILVVATARTETDSPLAEARIAALSGHARTRVVRPGPLSRSEMQLLVHERLGLSTDLAVRVEEVCQGNPLFAVQLVGDWVQRGQLRPGQDGFDLGDGAQVELPADLHAPWDARVARLVTGLAEHATVSLERAAVLGMRVDAPTWEAACRADDPPDGPSIRARLVERGLDARLLRTTPRGVRFVHPMLRESLLRRAREAGRLELHHRRCAEALRARPELAWRGLSRLGRHLYSAGDRAEAIEPLLRAADGWRRAGGHRESLTLLGLVERALDDDAVPDTDPRWAALVRTRVANHQHRGEYAEATAWAGRALALAERVEDPEARAGLLLAATALATHRRQWDEAHAHLERARAHLSGEPGPALALELHFAEGHLARGRGELERSDEAIRRALALATTLGDAGARGLALRDLGVLAGLRRDTAGARSWYEQARAVLADGGGLKDLASTLNNLGECCRAQGDLDGAERYYLESAALFDRAGAAASAPFPYLNLGLVRIHTGRHQEALPPLTRALQELDRRGTEPFEAVCRALIAACCAAVGDWTGWTRQLDRIEALSMHLDLAEPGVADAVRAASDIAVQAQRTHEALRGYDLAVALYRHVDDLPSAQACARARDALSAQAG
jgi:serine/threonine protein kinase/tetratricopeptide (TPR) repeat protein